MVFGVVVIVRISMVHLHFDYLVNHNSVRNGHLNAQGNRRRGRNECWFDTVVMGWVTLFYSTITPILHRKTDIEDNGIKVA